MIRPITCIACLLACGSGLYLYQTKHRVKVLDDHIGQIIRSTDALRAQTRMLSAEWTLLNDPERLQQLASQFLTLKTVSPSQFTSLADLNSRLPPPVPPPSPASAAPVAQTGPAGTGTVATDGGAPAMVANGAPASGAAQVGAAAQADSQAAGSTTTDRRTADLHPADSMSGTRIAAAPPPAKPAAPVRGATDQADPSLAADHRSPPRVPDQVRVAAVDLSRATPPHAADQRSADQRALDQRRADQRSADQHSADQHSADQRAAARRIAEQRALAPHPAAPRPLAPWDRAVRPHRPPPVVAVDAPVSGSGGSLLGMAHDMAAPPAPMPMARPLPAPTPYYGGTGG